MKSKTLNIVKLSTLVLVASLATTIPVKSMAHSSGHLNTEILLSLPLLLNAQHTHEYEQRRHYQHDTRSHYDYKKPGHRHQSSVRHYPPKRQVHSYDGYSNDRIIYKHFK